MRCPSCSRDVWSADVFCRYCGAKLPPAPAQRGPLDEPLSSLERAVNSAIASLQSAWRQAEPHVDKAATEVSNTAEEAWRRAQPTINSAMKSIDDAVKRAGESRPGQKAKEVTKGAVDKAKPVVGTVAEKAEGAAKRLKERARR